MFIKLKHCEYGREPIECYININEINYIKCTSNYGCKKFILYLRNGVSSFMFYEEEIKPLLDYMQSNNLMINTNT